MVANQKAKAILGKEREQQRQVTKEKKEPKEEGYDMEAKKEFVDNVITLDEIDDDEFVLEADSDLVADLNGTKKTQRERQKDKQRDQKDINQSCRQ